MKKMNLTTKLLVAALALIALTGSEIVAQEQRKQGRQRGSSSGRSVRGSTPSLLNLMRTGVLKNEIKLTEEQQQKVTELFKSYSSEQRKLFGGFREASDDEKAQMREKYRKVTQETAKSLAAVLDEAQTKRVDQIIWQMQGIRALRIEKVQKLIGLSAEQVTKLKNGFAANDEVNKKRFADSQEFYASIRKLPREEQRKKLSERREQQKDQREEWAKAARKFYQDTLAVLTEEQQKKFEEVKGKKFEFPRRSRNRQRGNSGRPQRPSKDDEKKEKTKSESKG